VVSAARPSDFPTDHRPEIAFVGRSNVGKSSLINSLLSSKLARTSQTPGKTQTINFYCVNELFYFVDLPGYGFAKVAKYVQAGWQKLIEAYLSGRDPLRFVVLIVDARHAPMETDVQMKSWLEHYSIPHVVVATKADKLSHSQIKQSQAVMLSKFETGSLIIYSAVTGMGKRELWKEIETKLERFV
jgi:GTP-binding protein